MFKYQIHKLSRSAKEARAVMLEDILTSDVFGLMTYFPYDLIFKPFLDRLKLKNTKSVFPVPSKPPSEINFWKSYNWPESLPYLKRESIEPDVVIEWDDILLIVEAKFLSPTDAEELLREYLVGSTEAGSNKQFYLLLIDRHLSAPSVAFKSYDNKISISNYIENRVRDIQISDLFPTDKIHTSVLWTNWQSVYSLIDRLLIEDASGKYEVLIQQFENILKDFLHILERKGLIPFEPISLEDFQRWHIDLNILGELGLKIRSSFSNFSDITIDIEHLGNVGLRINNPISFLSESQLDNANLSKFLKL